MYVQSRITICYQSVQLIERPVVDLEILGEFGELSSLPVHIL